MELYTRKPAFLIYLFIICCVLNALITQCNGTDIVVSDEARIPAVIVFGDSIVDTGNNNNITTLVKCNFPPYGRDFVGGKATGRFSNGKVPSDFIAAMLGVKETLPAYLDPDLKLQDLLTGVSFASGGAGYDPITSDLVSVLSLSDQVDMFGDYIAKIRSAVGNERTAALISESIYVVCLGSDDIANNYFSNPDTRSQYDIDSYTNLMITSATHFFQGLNKLGARKVAVVGLPPIGCLPSQRTIGGGVTRGCLEPANQAAKLFNSKLSSAISSHNEQHENSRLVYFDIYDHFLSLIQHPVQYGFEEANMGCCGTGNIEVSVLCNAMDDSGTCADASKYVFWDSYHPSEKAYQILIHLVFSRNLHKLLELL